MNIPCVSTRTRRLETCYWFCLSSSIVARHSKDCSSNCVLSWVQVCVVFYLSLHQLIPIKKYPRIEMMTCDEPFCSWKSYIVLWFHRKYVCFLNLFVQRLLDCLTVIAGFLPLLIIILLTWWPLIFLHGGVLGLHDWGIWFKLVLPLCCFFPKVVKYVQSLIVS